jgi:hypothetical protein
MTVDPQVRALCAEFDVKIIAPNAYPVPGETRATATIRRLIDHHGIEHARLVMCILSECKGNHALIDMVSLNAVSGLLQACPDLVEEDTSALLELFDQIPFGPYMVIANELRGAVPQAHALAGMLYLHLRRAFELRGGHMTERPAARGRHEAADYSEVQKGRTTERIERRHRSEEQKRAIGVQLIEAKASLPHGEFGPWLKERGISSHLAHTAMQIARQQAPQMARAA